MIESVEEAQEYCDKVIEIMEDLTDLSDRSGLPGHSAIWITVAATFCIPSEVEHLIRVIAAYMPQHMERVLATLKAKSKEKLRESNPFSSMGD